MILGHASVTFMAYSLAGEKIRKAVYLPLLLVGAYLPDLMDKPMSKLLGVYPPRGIFHSVIVMSLIFYVAFRLFPERCKIVLTLLAGVVFHLLEDFIDPVTFDPKVLLWPLLGSWEYFQPVGIWIMLKRFYSGEWARWLWTGEMFSMIYCFGYFVARARFRSDMNNS